MDCPRLFYNVLDPALLWLWHGLAAVALIGPLAWESPYATSVALKRKKKRNKQRPLYNDKGISLIRVSKFDIISKYLCILYRSILIYKVSISRPKRKNLANLTLARFSNSRGLQ